MEVRDIRENEKYIEELIGLGSNMTPTFRIGDQVLIGFDPNKIKEVWERTSNS